MKRLVRRRDCFGAPKSSHLAMTYMGPFQRFLAAVWMTCTVSAGSIAAIDFPNSHDMALGGTLLLSGAAPSTVLDAPGCRIDEYSAGLEIGYARRYDLSDLDQLFIAGAGRYKNVSGAIGLAQFGKSDLYAERTVKGSVTYSRQELSFGLSASLFQIEFGGNYGKFHTATVGAGFGYTKKQLRVLFAADNLTRPKLFSGAEPYPRKGSIHLEWKTVRRLSTSARATKVENQKVRYGLGQRIPLSGSSALYWGVSTRPVEYGGGVDIGTKGVTFTYAARIYPVLGLSQNVSVSITRAGKKGQTSDIPEQEFE